MTPTLPASPGFVEEVEIHGHIIDSLLLPKVLDEILTRGGSYVIKDIRVGQRQDDPSFARIEVRADTAEKLERHPRRHPRPRGRPRHTADCSTVPADMDGAFPEGFYSTTNYRTQVRLQRRMDRRRRPGDGLRHRRRSGRGRGPLRAHDRRAQRRPHRRRPAGAARLPGRGGRPRHEPLRVHGQPRVERKAQGRDASARSPPP